MKVLSLKVYQQTHCHYVIVLHNVKYHYAMQKYHFVITDSLFVCHQKTLQVSHCNQRQFVFGVCINGMLCIVAYCQSS